MRRLLIIIFICFCITKSCYAASCYGSKFPKKNSFFAGIQTHSLLKRYLANGHGKMRSLQNFVLVSYGLFDWLSIDLKGGAGNVKHHPTLEEEFEYSAYLGGGYGFRVKVYDCEKKKIVFGFQHISIHPHLNFKNGIKNKSVLDDWQISLLGAYDFSLLSPYIGTKWSRIDYIHWVNADRSRKKSDLTKSIGLVIGMDIQLNEKTWINTEGQLFDNEAFSLSLNFKF